ncbi:MULTISPECIES: DMT family transporter [Aminobacterium]|uniref:DMT family transporter n=1 Tax=Aminobacterium TaxID=81466 RepID=UPI00257E7E1A|nr:DMT family transporter [Aminobacterium sp. UBA4834]
MTIHLKNEKPFIPPFIVLTLGIAAISTGAIFARLADGVHPLVIAAYRVGLASLILCPLAGLRCKKEISLLQPREWWALCLAGIFLALHFAFWISSLFYTSVANSVVIVDTIPVWTAILSPIVTKDLVRKKTKIGIAIAFAGGVIISLGDFSLGEQALWGDFLALLGAWTATCYFLCGRIARRKISLLTYTSLCYGIAALCLWSVICVKGVPVRGFDLSVWGAFWGMALIPQILGHSSYNWALRYVNPGAVSVALLGEPVVSSFLAWLIWEEAVGKAVYSGGALILLGIYIVSRSEAA